MQEFIIEGYQKMPLACTKYDNVANAKAVIVVIHGMQEHQGRYVEFAKKLNNAGYIVITSDSRGHGKTMPDPSKYGHGNGDIYAETVQDQLNIIEYAKANYNLPIYLFGHSYGSMLSQRIIQVSPDIKKAVLCGTSYGKNLSYISGKILANILKFFGQDDAFARPIEKLSLDIWGKNFNGNWLSRDEEVYTKYKQDPLCGGSFPISFYRSLFSNMTKVNKTVKQIGNKKILLIVGSNDPVSSNAKLVKKLHNFYLKNGINSNLIVYPEARHELINETNKEEVYNDVINFYEK